MGLLLGIVALVAFFAQAYLVSQRVKATDGGPLSFGKVLGAQVIILAVAVVIILIIVAALGGF